MPSEKQQTAAAAGFESSLERDFFVLLEFDLRVERWDPQPVRIVVGDSYPSYVPDVLVTYLDYDVHPQKERRVLYEVKYRDELRKNWALWKARFRAARRFAKEQGWRFQIITEREIRGSDLLWNAKFLLPYLHDHVDDGIHTLLIKSLRHLGVATPGTLIAHCSKDRWEQARLLAAVWTLVSARDIRCDLTQRLTMNTEIVSRD